MAVRKTPGGDTSKRGTVTDEHREEAARLKKIWDARKGALGTTQEKFGHDNEIGNQAAVGFFLNGKTALSLKAARGFARGLGCEISDFSPRIAKLLAEHWPFPAIERERYERLNPAQRLEVQRAMRRSIEDIEADSGKATGT